MARPREFDREVALTKAMEVFWAKGFAATSTEDLLAATGIGRQSLYNAFGDKRQLYLEALRRYEHQSMSGHLMRLNAPKSALAGIEDLIVGLISEDDSIRRLGCMGVCAVGEFGVTDSDLVEMREKAAPILNGALAKRIMEGQANGEIDPSLDPMTAAGYVQMAIMGIQVLARADMAREQLEQVARCAVDRFRVR